MISDYSLSALPSYAKVFVGIFTTLMLCVCAWAVTIFYVEKGMVRDSEQSWRLQSERSDADRDLERQQDAELYAENSQATVAPIWDSTYAGREVHADSVSNVRNFRQSDARTAAETQEADDEEPDLRENIGLAHTHINGQTLLFFAMGLVFLFTSVKPRTKKILYCIFGPAVVLHAIGLSGEGYHWFFDDILAISGVVIVGAIVFMALRIYVDLARSHR
ncbi:MAG TPA: hypothetical protein VN285_00695 [Candidatus Deferrimicrobium sp.]|nr:hypothetical protein [Candidatus Deferrimicrobium sp.]